METSANTAELDRLLRHSEWLRRLARRLVGDASTAEDLVQETYLAALKNPPDPLRPARPWLAGVMRNLVKLRARTEERRRRRQERAAKRDELPSTAELLENVDTSKRLAEEVVALPEPYRGTLLLHYYHDLSAAEISRRQGIPAGTVRWRIKRGLEALRARLDRAWPDRDSWCVAMVALGRARGGGLAAPALSLHLLGSAVAWKGFASLLLLGAVGWLALWLARDGAPTHEVRAAALPGPAEVAPEGRARPGVALAELESGTESVREAELLLGPSPVESLRLVLQEHDGRPAAGWRGMIALGSGAVESFVLDDQGQVRLPAHGETTDLFFARPDSPVLHLQLDAGEGERVVRLPRGREVAGHVIVDGRPPEEPIEILLSTDRPLHVEALERLGLKLSVFNRELVAGRRVRTSTEADGSFLVHGMDADWSGLISLPQGYRLAGGAVGGQGGSAVQLLRGEIQGPRVHLGAPASGVVLELSRLPRLRGRVVDASTGEPLPGALVHVRFETERGLILPKKKERQLCDAEGRFEAWFLDEGMLAATVRCWDPEGARGQQRELRAEQLVGGLDLGDLKLAAGSALALRVTEPGGAPIAGARAWCAGMLEPSVASDDQGSLTLTGWPAEADTIFVGAPGRLSRRVPMPMESDRPLEVELEAANRLVVRMDEPCPGLSFELIAERGPFADGAESIEQLAFAGSGAARPRLGPPPVDGLASFGLPQSGEVELIGLEPNLPMQLVLLDALGEPAGELELAPLGPAEEREVTLRPEFPLGELIGLTRIEGVGAMVGLLVTLRSPTGGQVSIRTDHSGEFHFRGIAAERVDVAIAKPGFVRVELQDKPVGREHPPLDVQIERGVTLRVVVVDQDGQPVAEAEASATRADDARVWSSREREGGRLEIPDVPPSGVLTVEVRARGRVLERQHDPLSGELRVELPE